MLYLLGLSKIFKATNFHYLFPHVLYATLLFYLCYFLQEVKKLLSNWDGLLYVIIHYLVILSVTGQAINGSYINLMIIIPPQTVGHHKASLFPGVCVVTIVYILVEYSRFTYMTAVCIITYVCAQLIWTGLSCDIRSIIAIHYYCLQHDYSSSLLPLETKTVKYFNLYRRLLFFELMDEDTSWSRKFWKFEQRELMKINYTKQEYVVQFPH